MRVALLSTMESLDAEGGDPRGFLFVAGRSVVQHQLECALALGCEKIACQAFGLPKELLALQHLAELAGAQFQVISGPRTLSGMVKAGDELMVFADGMLPEPALAETLLAHRPTVLVLPADEGMATGFERVDRDYAWAGLFTVRGQAIERLGDLPPDADPIAGLLRIALQAGARITPMPPGILASREWGLVRSEADAAEFETAWLNRHVQAASFAAPSLAMADRAATHIVQQGHARSVSGEAILAVAAGLAVIAGLTGWLWLPAAGMALLALAYFIAWTGGTLLAIEGVGSSLRKSSRWIAPWLGAGFDALLVFLAALANSGSNRNFVIFGVTALLIALRLGSALPLGKWKILLADRTLLAIALSLAAYFSELIVVTQALTIIFLAAILIDTSRSKITHT